MGRVKGGTNKKKSPTAKAIESSIDNSGETIIMVPEVVIEKKDIKVDPKKLERTKLALAEINKTFGKDTVKLASDEEDKERIPFGVPEIDKLTGGLRCGLFTVLWGNKSVCKSTLALNVISQAQKLGKICLYIDLEGTFDKELAKYYGCDIDKLLLCPPTRTAEEAMDLMIKLSNDKAIDLVVLDSIQSMCPEGEKETKKGVDKSMSDETMALLARKLSQFFRNDASGVYHGKVAMLLIGQARKDLGSFIKLDCLSGGNALTHWACMVVKLFRGSKADAPKYKFHANGKSKEIQVGFSLCARLEKRKVSNTAPEGAMVQFDFYDSFGFVRPSDEQLQEHFKDWISLESED